MSEKIYRDYFEDKEDFDKNHFDYKNLKIPEGVEAQPLTVPPVLKPDKETATDVWFTLESIVGESQILPGEKTKTWGYNAPLLGKTMVVEKGKRVHVTLKNSLPELTTYHWHGIEVPGPITDGGCHAPVYPGEEKQIEFTVHEHNQLDYRADYNQMGIFGDTPMINGVVRPYVDVTTQKVRLLFLGGSNRREWRLHFDDDLVMTQIAGDDSFLPHPIKMTKLLVTPGERLQVVVDFGQYHEGDVVSLYTDDFKLIEFRIHKFEDDNSEIPATVFTPEIPEVDPSLPVRKVTMDGCDKMNGKRFAMQRIDMKQKVGQAEYWDVTNSKKEGMIHPFHIHGTHFLVVSRNGKKPYPNEVGVYKDTVPVAPGETVRLLVKFPLEGVFMYHCHIIEHEDAGMMAQIEIFDPDHRKTYKLMDMKTLTKAFAEERGVKPEDVWMPGMDTEGCDMKKADVVSGASEEADHADASTGASEQ